MKNLIINRIKFIIKTISNNNYGADISFTTGLNIIYGPNSVGKSSLITGIIYCLGGERGLGIFQNKQNPFKPEFYEKIDNEAITTSYILLEISNGEQIITLARSIINKTDYVGVKECNIDSFDSTKKSRRLIARDDGVFSENGLQYYLFNFLGWSIVEIPTYENSVSKLYFENVLPLFFVEQRAGWSQIQSRQVTRYGIREVKKVAFEYLLGLDKFEIHLKEIERKELNDKIQKLKAVISETEENLVVLTQGRFEDGVLLIHEHGYGRASIFDIIELMKKTYDRHILQLENFGQSSDDTDEIENSLREKLRITNHKLRKENEKIKFLEQEVASYVNYIERIEINKRKNKQLKRIEEFKTDFNISVCPLCENTLDIEHDETCKLCHHDIRRKISSPDENLNFLEDEKTSFEKILTVKTLELKKSKYKYAELKDEEKSIVENLDHQIKTYINPQLDKYRDLVLEVDKLKILITRYNRVVERIKELNKRRDDLVKIEIEEEKLKTKIRSFKYSVNDAEIMKMLIDNFRNNVKKLRLFKDKTSLINNIKIDENDNYTPYLDDYDLYNISSSSDNVRIILSYYLAILQTSIAKKSLHIRFPNLLILDEPKQQNLDNEDINTFIDILEHMKGCQVILTTFSEQKKDKKLFENFIRLEMHSESDYLIKKMPS